MAPSYISDHVSLHCNVQVLRSYDQMIFNYPHSPLKLKGNWVISVAAPRLWNSLPPSIKSSLTIDILSKIKKLIYFTRRFSYFNEVGCLFCLGLFCLVLLACVFLLIASNAVVVSFTFCFKC